MSLKNGWCQVYIFGNEQTLKFWFYWEVNMLFSKNDCSSRHRQSQQPFHLFGLFSWYRFKFSFKFIKRETDRISLHYIFTLLKCYHSYFHLLFSEQNILRQSTMLQPQIILRMPLWQWCKKCMTHWPFVVFNEVRQFLSCFQIRTLLYEQSCQVLISSYCHKKD